MNTPRYFGFDLLRILLILIVLHVHVHLVFSLQHDYISNFDYLAVPLFVILSFFLNSKYYLHVNISNFFFFKRIQRLCIPLVIYSLVGFLLNSNLFTIYNLLVQLITGQVVNLPLYYLNILIFFTVLFYLTSYIRCIERKIVWIFLLLFAFYMQFSELNYKLFMPKSWFTFGRILELLPYAIVGLILGLYRKQITEKKTALLFCIFAVLAFIISLSLTDIHGFYYQGLSLFFLSIFIFTICIYLQSKILLINNLRIIKIIGEYTYGVFLSHYLLLELISKLLPAYRQFIVDYHYSFLFLFLIFNYSLCFSLDYITARKFTILFR